MPLLVNSYCIGLLQKNLNFFKGTVSPPPPPPAYKAGFYGRLCKQGQGKYAALSHNLFVGRVFITRFNEKNVVYKGLKRFPG